MKDRERIALLAGIMVVLNAVVVVTATLFLYHTAMDEKRNLFREMARSRKILIESVAAFDQEQSRFYSESTGREVTLYQLREAAEGFPGFGKTGEFTLATLQHDSLIFLLPPRYIPKDSTLIISLHAGLAEPMMLALEGDSGVLIGKDYRGATVLAAYEPVPSLNAGLVVKKDLSEIRTPYLVSGLIAFGIGLVLVVIGAISFNVITSPILKRIQKAHEELTWLNAHNQAILGAVPGMILEVDKNGIIEWANTNAEAFFGKSVLNGRLGDFLENEDVFTLDGNRTESINTLSVIQFETQLNRIDGEERQIAWWWKKMKDVEGNPAGALGVSYDITGQKLAEQERNEIEQQFRELVERSPVPQVFVNDKGELAFRNSAFESMVGYTHDDIQTVDQWYSLAYPDEKYRAEVLAIWNEAAQEAAAADRPIRPIEYNVTCKSGEVKVIEISGIDIGNNYLVTLSDMTERRAMLKQIREKEEKFRNLIERSPVPQAYVNAEGKFDFWNAAFERMFGYTSEDVTNLQHWWERAYPDEAYREWVLATWNQKVEEAAAKSVPIEPVEYDVTCRNGDVKIMEISGVTIGDAFLATFSDMTERRAMEEDIRASEAKFRTVFEKSKVGKSLTSPEGLLLQVNKAFADMVGLSMEEMHTINFAEITHPDDVEESRRCISTLLSGAAEDCNMEKRYIHKDGHIVWTTVNTFLFRDKEQKPEYFITVALDISDRVNAEQKVKRMNAELEERVLERTAELTAINQELEAFAYSVSHDLRAPLRAVNGYSQFLLEDYGDKLDPEGHRLIGVIRSSAKDMGNLIDDLLRFSRLSRRELKTTSVNIGKMAEEVCEELLPLLSIENHERPENVELVIEDTHPSLADHTMMEEVLKNLLSNALKYSSTRNPAIIRICSELNGNNVVFSIEDNGVGFNMEYVEKVFQVFQRLHRVTEFPGTGIGLALVQRILSKHGGEIWAESEEGKGATFHFSLPQA